MKFLSPPRYLWTDQSETHWNGKAPKFPTMPSNYLTKLLNNSQSWQFFKKTTIFKLIFIIIKNISHINYAHQSDPKHHTNMLQKHFGLISCLFLSLEHFSPTSLKMFLEQKFSTIFYLKIVIFWLFHFWKVNILVGNRQSRK